MLFKNILSVFSKTIRRNFTHIKLTKKDKNIMHKAYFHYEGGEEQFQLTFMFSNSSENVTRQFNFSRSSTEKIGTLLSRIDTNVQKVVAKKSKKKAKKNPECAVVETRPLDVKLTVKGEEVSHDVICIDVLKPENENRLHILGDVYNIIINAPWVSNISLPHSFLANYPAYPKQFEGRFLAQNNCVFEWYTTQSTENVQNIPDKLWSKVGNGFIYFPSTTDIGKVLKLKCIPHNNGLIGPETEVISKSSVEAGPGVCPFENRHNFTKNKLSDNLFRVISYNILADQYCDSEFTRTVLFPYCPPYALHIDYRKQLFLKEILGYNGDIVCLQEVDSRVFDLDLTPVLGQSGLKGIYSKKKGNVAEGVACFYREERYKLIEDYSWVLSDELSTSAVFNPIYSVIKDNQPFCERITSRSTVCQTCVLESIDNPDEIIVVGNTHLYFHPDADHVRLTQAGLIILWLNDFISHLQKRMPSKRISLLLCGDFNTVPSCGIYQLYTKGVAPSDLEDWKSNEAETVSGLTLTQPIPLASACGTPEFTNFTAGFSDCLDYIFYNTENLSVSQVVPFPCIEELNQHTALPSILFPSDHVALIADLEFIK